MLVENVPKTILTSIKKVYSQFGGANLGGQMLFLVGNFQRILLIVKKLDTTATYCVRRDTTTFQMVEYIKKKTVDILSSQREGMKNVLLFGLDVRWR